MNKPNNKLRAKRTIVFLLAALGAILLTNSARAQHPDCGTEKYLEEQVKIDPGLIARMEAAMSITQPAATAKGMYEITSSTITIPVVVHVVYNTTAQNISDAQIQSQIDALNEDYRRLNADTINTPAVFKPYAANAGIQFVLAKRDPNGNATSGITRTATASTYFTSNNYVKFDSYGGKSAWNTTQYLNIWVCNLSGYGGYSAMPGETASIDGVVINYLCFGRTGTLMSTRNKGRATTHEIGHWLGLAHTWGWSGTCGDDNIGDTPKQEKANSGIPAFPHLSSCSPNSYGDMFMNYMDYSDDAALNMFTLNQAAAMNATLNGYRSALLTSLGGVAPGTAPACNIPGGLNASSLTASGANLSWTSTGALSYNVRYKQTSSSVWNTLSSATTSSNLSGLANSTTYEFQVASVCSGGSVSAFSGSAMFTTAAASSPVSLITIGNSNSLMSDAPYGTAFVKEHAQFIITKSELVAAGYNAGNNVIKSLSFFVNTASAQSLNAFTIKIAHTSVSSFAGSGFLSTSSAATVYYSNYLTAASAWNKHAFTSLFTYNGNDNLLIDVTWSNSSSSASSQVKCTAGSSYQSLYYGATSKRTNLGKITSGTLTLNRPNMLFEFAAPTARLAAIENIAEPAARAEMELYPNPASEVMNIAISGIAEATLARIYIFNIAGALVAQYEQVMGGSEKQIVSLDLNSTPSLQILPNGIYICVVDVNDQRIAKKFILGRN